jgi:hypothetical protein
MPTLNPEEPEKEWQNRRGCPSSPHSMLFLNQSMFLMDFCHKGTEARRSINPIVIMGDGFAKQRYDGLRGSTIPCYPIIVL